MVSQKRFEKVSDVARLLGTSRGKIYRMIETGDLPAIKLGSMVRIPTSAIDALINRSIGV